MGSQKALNDMATADVLEAQAARKKMKFPQDQAQTQAPSTTASAPAEDPTERARKIVEANPAPASPQPASALIDAAQEDVKPLDESKLGGVVMTDEMKKKMKPAETELAQAANKDFLRSKR